MTIDAVRTILIFTQLVVQTPTSLWQQTYETPQRVYIHELCDFIAALDNKKAEDIEWEKVNITMPKGVTIECEAEERLSDD